MTENKTSQAADELLFNTKQAAHLSEAKYVHKDDLFALGAIYERCKRMEEALQKVAGGGCPSGECSAADIRYGECYCAPRIAQEALDFDPLSQQDK